MIVTRMLGGLGNQMFQYAAGLALAEHHRTVLKLDVSWFRNDSSYEAHNRYALSCLNVTEQFATAEEIEHARGFRLSRPESALLILARALRFRRIVRLLDHNGNHYVPASFAPTEEFFAQPDPTYLDGMWQSEAFFQPVAGLLRQHFTFRYPAPPAVEELGRRIDAGPSIAVHFRRGDYVRNKTFNREIGVVDLSYYDRALEILHPVAGDSTLYCFSDDIDWVEQHFRPEGWNVHYARVTRPHHSYDKIRLMARCNHAIIANSTFSWWAAWLNPSADKKVVAPDPWFAGSAHDSSRIVPDSWIRLATNGGSA